jgi:hypothetical protein
MIFSLHIEVLLALAYAMSLVSVAAVLEFLAQRSQKRAEGYRQLRLRPLSRARLLAVPHGPAIATA